MMFPIYEVMQYGNQFKLCGKYRSDEISSISETDVCKQRLWEGKGEGVMVRPLSAKAGKSHKWQEACREAVSIQ